MASSANMDDKDDDLIIEDLSDDEEYSQESLRNLSLTRQVPNRSFSLPYHNVSSSVPVTRLTNTCPPSITADIMSQNISTASDLPSISEHIIQESINSSPSDKQFHQSSHDNSKNIDLKNETVSASPVIQEACSEMRRQSSSRNSRLLSIDSKSLSPINLSFTESSHASHSKKSNKKSMIRSSKGSRESSTDDIDGVHLKKESIIKSPSTKPLHSENRASNSKMHSSKMSGTPSLENQSIGNSKLSNDESMKHKKEESHSLSDESGELRLSCESSINIPLDFTNSVSSSHPLDSKIDENLPSLKSSGGISDNNKEDSYKDHEFLDSLTEEALMKEIPSVTDLTSKTSDEVIKLDIRGQAAQKNLSFTNPLYNQFTPKKDPIISRKTDEDLITITKENKTRIPSPVIIRNPVAVSLPLHDDSITDEIKIEDVTGKDLRLDEIIVVEHSVSEDGSDQLDCLLEEIVINDSIIEEENDTIPDAKSARTPKSPLPNVEADLNASLSTYTTEYRTFGDDFNNRFADFQNAITERETIIERLTVSLQESIDNRELLQIQNEHLASQLGDLQQRFSEATSETGDITRGHLSDFVKHENMLREDNCSVQSSFKDTVSNVTGDAELIDKLKLEHEANIELINERHRKEVEELRTYFERKCHDIEKQYSEEVFSQQSARRSSCSSGDSLDRCPEALPFGSPLHAGTSAPSAGVDHARKRSKSVDYHSQHVEQSDELERQKQLLRESYDLKFLELRAEHDAFVCQMHEQHKKAISELKESHNETVAELKAHVQTLQNTEVNVTILNEDIDLELERNKILEERLYQVRQDVVHQLQVQIQALLGEPGADLSGSGCPVELSLLRDRIQADTHAHYQRQIEQMKKEHEDQLSSMRAVHESNQQYDGNSVTDKWRQRRNDSFDKNRHLEEVTKERDGLAQLSRGLQRVLRQLVGYFSACEDEVNNTLLEELLKQHLDITSSSDTTIDHETGGEETPLNTSLTDASQSNKRLSFGKRVHFAPDVDRIINQFDPDSVLDCVEKQSDVSIEIKNELDMCLSRLRQEAQELLSISSKFGSGRSSNRLSDVFATGDSNKQIEVNEVVQLREEIEELKKRILKLDLDKKELQEAITEGLHRENIIRNELQTALAKVAEYASEDEIPKSGEIVTEGYGICPTTRASRPPRTPRVVESPQTPRTPRSDSRHHSLDSVVHGQYYAARTQDLNTELEAVTKERDDLQLQLESTNRLLRSTREFLDDQTAERESERDQYHSSISRLKEEITKLNSKLQCSDTIISEMAQLEAQIKDTTNAITELENRKSETEANLQTAMEKITMLREIICNLELQLEEKITSEANLIKDLEQLRLLSEEKDVRIRDLQDEYDSLKVDAERKRSDKDASSGESEVEGNRKILSAIVTQLESLETTVTKKSSALERLYDRCPAHSNSEPTEDVSLADHRQRSSGSEDGKSEHIMDVPKDGFPSMSSPRRVLYRLSESLARHYRAEEAALKRIRDLEMQLGQLRDIAQEVRLERDALQQRLSEQALCLSSLESRLDAQRHAADTLQRDIHDKAAIQLHDAQAELQATKEALENREKQLLRLKTLVHDDSASKARDGEKGSGDTKQPRHHRQQPENKTSLESPNRCEGTDDERMLILLAERNADIELLKEQLMEKEQQLLDKEQQVNELMALKLEEDQPQEESENEIQNDANKNSARTLSDIISISEYDENDLQIRKAELRHQDTSNIFLHLSGDNGNKSNERTLPPRNVEHVEFANGSPRFNMAMNVTRDNTTSRAQSLPILEVTSSVKHINKSSSLLENYKRNVNSVLFGYSVKSDKHSTAHPSNSNSLLPNKEVPQKKYIPLEPKRINFSIPNESGANLGANESTKSHSQLLLDYDQKIFPDVLTQLKHEISKLNAELEDKNAILEKSEQQLALFNAVQTELEEVKSLFQDSVKTIEEDKKYYNEQIDNFTAIEADLKKRLEYAIIQANEKTSDLQVLKQDILKRENMVLDLAKEKRLVQQKLDEMELKLEVLQNKADLYESACTENERIRSKLNDLQNIEELISEKNIQIDSLNVHLDRLENLQRKLVEKDEELEVLKKESIKKSGELEQLKENIEKFTTKEDTLNRENKDLKDNLMKLQKEQDNVSLKEKAVEKREKDIEKTIEMNAELASKIEEMKLLNDRLKDKECEIEILNEDIEAFHDEITSLKQQLACRSPSPKDRSIGSAEKTRKKSGPASDRSERQAASDKKELGKITKQVIQLQNELGLNKKELNLKVFELERAKLEVIELRNELEIMRTFVMDKDKDIRHMAIESNALKDQLQAIADKIREDGNLEDLRHKLQNKCDECLALEREIEVLKEVIERMRSQSPLDNNRLAILAPGDASALARPSSSRSSRHMSINEIEERLRQEISTSQKLDESLLEQILADRNRAEEDVMVRSDGGRRMFSISNEHIIKASADNEQLKKQVASLEERIKDKDVLIQELNSIREGLMRDLQVAECRFEEEKDNGERLQLLLESERNTAKNIQEQDANMIHALKNRLELALGTNSELESSFREEQEMRRHLDKQLKTRRDQFAGEEALKDMEQRLEDESVKSERLLSEVQLLKAKRSNDKERLVNLQHMLDREKTTFQLEAKKSASAINVFRAQLVEMRQKERTLQSEVEHTRSQLQLRAAEVESLHERMNRLKNHTGRSHEHALAELMDQNTKLNKQKLDLINDMQLLKEKVAKYSKKEPIYSSTTVLNIHGDLDSQIQYLYSRYIRVESFRKALIHQKKYLLKNLMPKEFLLPNQNSARRKSFRSVVFCVRAIFRMRFLVKRWNSGRRLGEALFNSSPPQRESHQHDRTQQQQQSSRSYHVSSSPPCRERSTASRATGRESPGTPSSATSASSKPLQPHSGTFIYKDTLGVYGNPELFATTITINERKKSDHRTRESEDSSKLRSPSVNLESATLLSRYMHRLDHTAKAAKKALETPRH